MVVDDDIVAVDIVVDDVYSVIVVVVVIVVCYNCSYENCPACHGKGRCAILLFDLQTLTNNGR